MAKRPPITAETLVAQIRASRERWNEIRQKGTRDPFWRDGSSMNMVREQIISGQEQLLELCKTQKLKSCPVEAKQKPPRIMPKDYMVPGSKAAKHAWPPVERRKKK